MTTRTNRPGGQPTFFLVAIFVLFLLPACGRHHPRAFERNNRDGWIGVYVQDLDAELRDYLDVDTRHGVMVNRVVDGSPADDAGLQDEDVILRFDGRRIRKSKDLVRAVKRQSPGDRVKVEILRDGRERELRLRIGEKEQRRFTRAPRRDRSDRPGREEKPFVYSFSDNRRAWLGVRMAELNEDLAGYFDVDTDEGVLILSVEDGSPAAEAGLRGGDVIMEVDDEEVGSTGDLANLIGNKREGDEVEIRFKRKSRTKSVQVKLAHAKRNFMFHFNANPDFHERGKGSSKSWWNGRAFRNNMRELKDRIRIEVRDNIRHNARRIRHRIELDDLDLQLPDIDGQIHVQINREIQRDINKHLAFEMENLDRALDNLKCELECNSQYKDR